MGWCPQSDCTWITEEEFQKLDPILYDRFHDFNSTGSSSSKPGRNDGARYWQHLYKRRATNSSNAQALVWNIWEDGEAEWEVY